MTTPQSDFRFEKLKIWQEAIQISGELFEIAEKAQNQKKYRFAEQLNGATMSISNNIAEGSGSVSNKDFANYLMIARKSLFECVNILHVYQSRGLIKENERIELYPKLVNLSKAIFKFRQTLLHRY